VQQEVLSAHGLWLHPEVKRLGLRT
jgi:UDP-N-acetylenolpyruvoylglucosamine reductase